MTLYLLLLVMVILLQLEEICVYLLLLIIFGFLRFESPQNSPGCQGFISWSNVEEFFQ